MDKELTLEEIHQEILVVLKKVIEICEKININYFLAYGSLIGAVRHKGFIPWDDDLDIQMTRPEFNKFVDYCEKNAEELFPYKLVSFHNTSEYPYEIPRFCDMRFKMETVDSADAPMGIFVDIYPLDGIGNSKSKAKMKILPKKKYWRACWSFKMMKKFYLTKKNVIWDLFRFFIYLASLRHDIIFYLKKLETISFYYPYENSTFVECSTWNELFKPQPKECYSNFDYMLFEGIKVKVPKDYDKILRDLYGNYMRLPPVEKQKPSHHYKIFKR